MTIKTPDTAPNKYYFCDDATLTVFYGDEIEDGNGFVYLGTSDNPNPKMAVAAFTRTGRITSGYRIREL